MNVREELVHTVRLSLIVDLGSIVTDQDADDAAHNVVRLAEEHFKPRTITTVEELDALAENTVIRDAEPATMQLMDGRWWSVGSGNPWDADMLDLPATVIYTPEESK